MGVTFKPGQSGNPNGRPKGVGVRAQLFNALVAPYKEELIAKAMEMALGGNESMMRLLLDRLLPAKPVDDPIAIGKIEGTLAEKGEKVLTAITEGELTPTEGNAVLDAFASQAKIIESTKLSNLAEELEKLHNDKKSKK